MADTETGSDGEEEGVSEYEDSVETISNFSSEFKDELDAVHAPEGTAPPTARLPAVGRAPQHSCSTSKNGQTEWFLSLMSEHLLLSC